MQAIRDDQHIRERCAKGDREAFALLYSWYYKPLYRHVYLFLRLKEPTEEIIQNVFVKLWENRNLLANVQDLKPYLYRTAKNMLLNHLRKLETERRVLGILGNSGDSSENITPEILDHKEHKKLLQEAVSQLTDRRKEIFRLRMEEQLSLDEIAAKLSISRSVVKKQLYASIAFIRDYIHRSGGISASLLILLIKSL